MPAHSCRRTAPEAGAVLRHVRVRPGTAATRRVRGDRGQATSLLVIPVAAALVWLMITVMIGLGDGTRSRTQTRTAADAAALAAATALKEALVDGLAGLPAGPVAGLAALEKLLTASPADLAGSDPETQARLFATRNGAAVQSFSVVPGLRGPEFRVTTRSLRPARQTGVSTTAEATARLDVVSGLCWSGAALGIEQDGACTTSLKGLKKLPVIAPVNVQAVLVR